MIVCEGRTTFENTQIYLISGTLKEMSKWSVMIYNERRKDIEEVSGHKKFFYLKHGWTTGLEE